MKKSKTINPCKNTIIKKSVKKITAAVCIVSIIASCTLSTFMLDVIAKEAIVYDAGYVGLGDSIARGYGNLKGKSAVDMIGNLLLDSANSKNALARYNNYSQDGDESSHLLSKLRNSPEVISAIKTSTAVTVSIGGNNVMQELGRQVAIAVGIDPETNYNYSSDAADYVSKNPVSGSAKVVSHLNSTAFKEKMATIIAQFRKDMPQIIKEIKKLNSSTKIIIQTLYCPTKFIFLSSFLDNYITQLNLIIKEFASSGYTVVDIHSAFKNYNGGEDLTFTAVMSGFFDPHPTAAGQKLIFDNLYPHISSIIENLPSRDKSPQYKVFGNLKQNIKFAFDFDSSAFTAGTSIFASGNTAKNHIDIGSSQTANPAYDFKIVNTNHIKGLEFDMYASFDCTPIELKLNSAVNGTSFLEGTSVIPSNSTDHGVMFYVDTTRFTGQRHMLLQFQEIDFDGTYSRRGLKANSEAYMQDSSNNFTIPVAINSNQYLILPENYLGYIAIPFNSFKSIWGTTDINFAVDLKNVQSFSIYKGSDANGGKLIFDEFIFYGKSLTENAMSPAPGVTKSTGMPQNLINLFDFEDNRFVQGKSLIADRQYCNSIGKYLSLPSINPSPQFNFDIIGYDNIPEVMTSKALKFGTTASQTTNGQYAGIGLNVRQELGIHEKPVSRGNFVSSQSESDGVAFYIDLTKYTAIDNFALNLTWHEIDCESNGMPVFSTNSDKTTVEQQTSRNINSAYGNAEGVLDNGTSVALPLSGNSVTFPNIADGNKFKGWVKIPFAAFQTCWGSFDKNGAVDFYDIGGFDLYFSSYPSKTGTITIDQISFYGNAFASIANELKRYIPCPDIMNLAFNGNGTVNDLAGKSTVNKIGSPSIGIKNVAHKGVVHNINGIEIASSGQGLMANFDGISSRDAQKYLYDTGFSVEIFAVNKSPIGEQGLISSAQNGGWGLFTVNSGAKFITNTNESYKECFSKNIVSSTELVHYIGTYDYSTGKLSIYINGILDKIIDINGDFTPGFGEAFNKVAIGGDVDYYGTLSQSLMTNCTIVSAKIYGTALNALQTKDIYTRAVNNL